MLEILYKIFELIFKTIFSKEKKDRFEGMQERHTRLLNFLNTRELPNKAQLIQQSEAQYLVGSPHVTYAEVIYFMRFIDFEYKVRKYSAFRECFDVETDSTGQITDIKLNKLKYRKIQSIAVGCTAIFITIFCISFPDYNQHRMQLLGYGHQFQTIFFYILSTFWVGALTFSILVFFALSLISQDIPKFITND